MAIFYLINVLAPVMILLAGCSGFYIQPKPIVFTLEPETQLACEGCSAELTCEIPIQATASELPAPALGWTVNGTLISEAFDQSEFAVTSQSDSSSVRSTLRIVAARLEHTGWYRCVATDGDDTSWCGIHSCVPTVTISREAQLTILGNASGSVAVTISDCSSVFLACGVGGHSLDVTWSKDGLELLGEPGLAPLPSGGLLIAGTSNSSNVTGLYQCTVVFPGGQSVSVALYHVQHIEEMNQLNPQVEIVASLPVAIESRPFELICSTHNVCPEEFSWVKDGLPVVVGSGIELALGGSTLLFGSLKVGAPGNYCCLLPAGGGIGLEVKSCAQLSVVEKPSLGYVDAGSTVLLNRTTDNAEINLDCNNSTTGNSLQTVTWFWNGNVLDEALSDNGTRALNRSASNPMDLFGIYQCFASNPAGSVATLVRVLPLGLSNPPSKPTIEELPIANTFTNPHRVTLRFAWQPPHYTGGLSTLLYNISYNAAHRTIETLCSNISEAVGYTEYAMTVAVEVATVSAISGNVCPDIASEKASFSKFLNPVCINEVLFPPELTVSCNGSTFTTSWQNNQLNSDIYNKDTEYYALSRTWTYGNETQSSTSEMFVSGMDDITDLLAGTICTSTAAALPPLSDREANKQECYDLDRVQFSEVVECTIIADVSIEFSEYTVMEGGGQATVCVVANGFGFTVSLQTDSPGTADVDDFSEVFTFDSRENNRMCSSVPIKDNDIIEAPTEMFSVTLNSSDPYVVINRGIALVSIVDDDFALIGFEEDTYTVDEGAGRVTVCAAVEEGSRELGRDVIVELSVQNGTALDGEDFTSLEQTLIFNATIKMPCVEVEILDNERFESETKSFFIVLTSTDPAVNLSLSSTTVRIKNNDFALIGFEEDTYTVDEGAGRVTVCAAVEEESRELGRDVIVELSVQNGTALDGEDFTSPAQTLVFNAAVNMLCVEVEILDNERFESETKSFFIVLTSTDPAVNLPLSNTTVTIQDNDSVERFPVVAVTVSTVMAVAITAVLVVLLLLKALWKKQQKTSDSGYICDYMKAPMQPDNIVVPHEPPFMDRRESVNPEVIFYPLKRDDKEKNEKREIQEHAEIHPYSSERNPQTWVGEETASMDSATPSKLRRMGDNSHSGISVLSESEHGYVDMSASPDCPGRTCFVTNHKLVATPSLDSDTNTIQLQSESDGMNHVLKPVSETGATALHLPALLSDNDGGECKDEETVL